MKDNELDAHRHRNLAAVALATRKPHVTFKAVASELNLAPATLVGYMQDPAFREKVRKLTDDILTADIPQIDRAMVKCAIAGSVPAANYIAKRAGRITDVTEDKSFNEFVKKVESADQEEILYFMEHQRWPDQDAADVMPEPEREQ